jgi:cob(I)alamin adenosyltransferase
MNEAEKKILQNEINEGFDKFREITQRDDVDLIVVDEVLDCVYNKYLLKEIPEETLISILKNRKSHVDIALSGHNLSDKLKDVVDVISWVKLEKHYFYKGVKARKGIEY